MSKQYRTCEKCGSNLDFGEKCECEMKRYIVKYSGFAEVIAENEEDAKDKYSYDFLYGEENINEVYEYEE